MGARARPKELVRGGVVTSDARLSASSAERGMGLAYTLDPMVREPLRRGRLELVLERYAPSVPSSFTSRASRDGPRRGASSWKRAKELAVRSVA